MANKSLLLTNYSTLLTIWCHSQASKLRVAKAPTLWGPMGTIPLIQYFGPGLIQL